MQIEIIVPQMGESITEATVGLWRKAKGEAVAEGDVLVELETDKVMVEVPAVKAGVLMEILQKEGATVHVGDLLGKLDTEAKATPGAKSAGQPAASAPKTAPKPASPPAAAAAPAPARAPAGPAAARLAAERGVDLQQVPATGPSGRVTKEDIVNFAETRPAAPSAPARPVAPRAPTAARPTGEREERVKMTRLRQRIAERLLQAQQTAAILTTFNEVDMSAVMELRNRYKDETEKKYGMRLGFMSFFTKAVIEALRAFPAVNAEISGDEIIYKHFYDIGVAVGSERGLVVPVVREADKKRFIEIEIEIAELGKKARENKLTVDDLTGGTFTISNGGVFGSMLSTPILNPPQSAILGMHNIVKRAVVVNDQIVVRPMMYLALSYDHRLIDGREAVQFLVKVKQCIEDPARILLEL